MTLNEMKRQTKKLSVDDQMVLAYHLLKCVDEATVESELTEEQAAELSRRIEEHRKNPGAGVPWEEVERGILKRLKQKS